MFEKMKEIREKRLSSGIIMKHSKEEDQNDASIDTNKVEDRSNCILNPMDIDAKQDIERRTQQFLRSRVLKSGINPYAGYSISNNIYEATNNNKKFGTNRIRVEDQWITSGMIPGDSMTDLPPQYYSWRKRELLNSLSPDIQLRKNLLNESISRIKSIQDKQVDQCSREGESDDDICKAENSAKLFAPPLVMPNIKLSSRKHHVEHTKNIVNSNLIADLVTQQIQEHLENIVVDKQSELEKKIETLTNQIKTLESKATDYVGKQIKLAMESVKTPKSSLPSVALTPSQQNSTKKPLLSIIKSTISFVDTVDKDTIDIHQSKILNKPRNLPIETQKKLGKAPKEEHVPDLISVKFSHYVTLFSHHILKNFKSLAAAFKAMRPDSKKEVSKKRFLAFVELNKIPGNDLDHENLYKEICKPKNVLTVVSLYRNLNPLNNNESWTIEDFANTLFDIYDGDINLALSALPSNGEFIKVDSFVEFAVNNLGIKPELANNIWKNYFDSNNSRCLISVAIKKIINALSLPPETLLKVDKAEFSDSESVNPSVSSKELESGLQSQDSEQVSEKDQDSASEKNKKYDEDYSSSEISKISDTSSSDQSDSELGNSTSGFAGRIGKSYQNDYSPPKEDDTKKDKYDNNNNNNNNNNKENKNERSSARSLLSNSEAEKKLEKEVDDDRTYNKTSFEVNNSTETQEQIKDRNTVEQSVSDSENYSKGSSDNESDEENNKEKQNFKKGTDPIEKKGEVEGEQTTRNIDNRKDLGNEIITKASFEIVKSDTSVSNNKDLTVQKKSSILPDTARVEPLEPAKVNGGSSTIRTSESLNPRVEQYKTQEILRREAIPLGLDPTDEILPLDERFRKRVLDKYTTVAAAYLKICGGKEIKPNVNITIFGYFMESLNIYLPFTESKIFYKKVAYPDKEITIGSMYRYILELDTKEDFEPVEIGKYLSEIYGSVENAFIAKCLYNKSTIKIDEFISVCKESGFSVKVINDLFNSMVDESSDTVEVQDAIQCIEGHITPEEVKKDEVTRNSQWALWRISPDRKIPIDPNIKNKELKLVSKILINNIDYFQKIGKYELLSLIENYFMREQLPEGAYVYRSGDLDYSLSVIISGGVNSVEALWYGGENILKSFGEGEVIGIRMFEKLTSNETLRTNSETVLWKLMPNIWFDKFKPKLSVLSESFGELEDYINEDRVFGTMSDAKKKELFHHTIFTKYPCKTRIFKQGDMPKALILVFDGKVNLYVDKDLSLNPSHYRSLEAGSTIGDMYLINKEPYPYSAYCASDSDFVVIATVESNKALSILDDDIKKKMLALEKKYQDKRPIPIQNIPKFPSLSDINKYISNSSKVEDNTQAETNSPENLKGESKSTDQPNNNQDNKKTSDMDNKDKDTKENIVVKEEDENKELEYLHADIQSRILRRHSSLADTFKYIYKHHVKKPLLKYNWVLNLFDTNIQPSNDMCRKWPNYCKMFIGYWIDIDAFAEYVSEYLQINATFKYIREIYQRLCYPLKDQLYIGTFYRNFEEVQNLSLRDMNRRLVEIDKGVYNCFTEMAGITPGSSITLDTFIVVAARAGFTRDEASDIYTKQLDVLHNKLVSLTTLVKLVAGEITRKEAEDAESNYGLLNMAQDYFGRDNIIPKIVDLNNMKIDEEKFTSKYEDMKFDENKVIEDKNSSILVDFLGVTEPFNVLHIGQRHWLVAQMEKKEFDRDDKIITQGNPQSPNLFLISGELTIIQTSFFGYDSEVGSIREVAQYGWTEYYSTNQPSSVSVVAKTTSTVYILSRSYLEKLNLVISNRIEKIRNISALLLRTPNIRDWPSFVLDKLAKSLKVQIFNEGEHILDIGPCDKNSLKFYIVAKGTVHVEGVPFEDEEASNSYKLGSGRYFGEWAIINNYNERTCTIIAEGSVALLTVPKHEFKRVISEVDEYALNRFKDYGLKLYHFSPRHASRFNSPLRSPKKFDQ
ncbi:cyclic nucleotide-binding domain-containing protein [Cryptosporidium muris RN66]|uniref:Cyclic nucleotide-binding domain-containing protein n=1 Tax=Cryptosporidium muris (strain RN66) TaxID=441375 RepID=B6AHE6_CRYMR|nr:cyclic nucleotide-binding domain-containing protein [Cryptosporidium muris RN66]EEA07641.1 cyclic nucleotide-binding domain-containing protein [Cryptosporidium muris RN66]|eukprot:XP_002141990.1 cyclic nucleotide-binding domain-containing protein [Cryptosporidium muris RN66]